MYMKFFRVGFLKYIFMVQETQVYRGIVRYCKVILWFFLQKYEYLFILDKIQK